MRNRPSAPLPRRNCRRIVTERLCGQPLFGSGTASSPAPPSQEADAYGHYLSAHLAASEHDIADAATLYQAGLNDDPDNADLLNRAFLYTAAAGDMDTAAVLAQKVVDWQPGRPHRAAGAGRRCHPPQ